jgi:hypothetical protein
MRHLIESVQLPADLQSRVARLAEQEGVSVEQWVIEAVAAKADTAEFFNRRARGASGKTLGEILDLVPDNPPDPGDELPEGWKRP